jgi:2-hydroxy-3-oxopropionate reductase
MAGGDAAVLERAPLFECLGKTVAHRPGRCRPGGQGLQPDDHGQRHPGLRRGDAPGRRPRVDLHKVREALMGGSAASRVLDVMGGRMARRDFARGIQARLHHKDFAILMDEARQLGAPLPVAAQTWQQLNALMAMGGGRDDTASLLRVLEPVQCKGA